MSTLVGIITLALAILAFRRRRWAYFAFVILGVLRIPSRTGFRLRWPECSWSLALEDVSASLAKFPHIALFAIFFCMTWLQFRSTRRWRWVLTTLATLALGAVVELEQGATATGNCRLADLVPDAAGALVGAILMVGWERVRCAGSPEETG